MWLLHAEKRKLEHFDNELEVPGGYAILSHRWGKEAEEVLFSEIHDDGIRQAKVGYHKIDLICRWALLQGLNYVWADTCCIDKKSSAELSEAINSMFRYYSNAMVCYVYLSDVSLPQDAIRDTNVDEQTAEVIKHTGFSTSEWFTRGWTLQELIAPQDILFHDVSGNYLGTKHDLAEEISKITSIDIDILRHGKSLSTISVAARMSWSAWRITSRVEDQAYCLLGIFDINMPLLYGEGDKAFWRLQEAIITQSTVVDHSILTWMPWENQGTEASEMSVYNVNSRGNPSKSDLLAQKLLSPSPRGFRKCKDIISWSLPQLDTFELSPRGLRLSVHAVAETLYGTTLRAALNCRYKDKPKTQILLRLRIRSPVHPLRVHQESRKEDGIDEVCDLTLLDSSVRTEQSSISAQTATSWNKTTLTLAKHAFRWQIDRTMLRISGFFASKLVDTYWFDNDNVGTVQERLVHLPTPNPRPQHGTRDNGSETYTCLFLANLNIKMENGKKLQCLTVHIRYRLQADHDDLSVCISTSPEMDTETLNSKRLLPWYPWRSGGHDFNYQGHRILRVVPKLVMEAETPYLSIDIGKAEQTGMKYLPRGEIDGTEGLQTSKQMYATIDQLAIRMGKSKVQATK